MKYMCDIHFAAYHKLKKQTAFLLRMKVDQKMHKHSIKS